MHLELVCLVIIFSLFVFDRYIFCTRRDRLLTENVLDWLLTEKQNLISAICARINWKGTSKLYNVEHLSAYFCFYYGLEIATRYFLLSLEIFCRPHFFQLLLSVVGNKSMISLHCRFLNSFTKVFVMFSFTYKTLLSTYRNPNKRFLICLFSFITHTQLTYFT